MSLTKSIGSRARQAASELAGLETAQKRAALQNGAKVIRVQAGEILKANQEDYGAASARGVKPAFLDRLLLNSERIEAMVSSLEMIAGLPDPVGEEIARWQPDNGLDIARVRVPLGVIGVIYESRPNVTIDAGALCFMSGNAAVLRGGSECARTNRVLAEALTKGFKAAGVNPDCVQLMPSQDRQLVGAMLQGLGGSIDVIVPRGGKALVARVQEEARVPVFAHLEGICHIYLHESAEIEAAVRVITNAKLRRTGICGAAECLLVDQGAAASHLPPVLTALHEAGCEIHGDEEVSKMHHDIVLAGPEDWGCEFGDKIIAVRLVDGLDAALAHIREHGSNHTDAVLANDPQITERFLNEVDSAIVMHNASTQFADGGEFGFGAEIGIATGRMHARGPIGLEQLTCFKYKVRGNYSTRP